MKDSYLIQLIDKLTAIYLMQGIQPSELADAIFDEPYTNMISKKHSDFIEVVLSFKERCDVTNKVHIRSIKYIYSFDRYLLQTSESIDSKAFKITWDRENSIKNIISEIKLRLTSNGFNSKEIEKFLSTLPPAPQKLSVNTNLSLAS